MPVSIESLEEAIRSRLDVQHVQAFDISGQEAVEMMQDVTYTDAQSSMLLEYVYSPTGGCGQSYEVIIVSSAFDKLPTFRRHKMVNAALKEEIGQLHAFTQKTFTPEQWKGVEVKVETNRPATPTKAVETEQKTS